MYSHSQSNSPRHTYVFFPRYHLEARAAHISFSSKASISSLRNAITTSRTSPSPPLRFRGIIITTPSASIYGKRTNAGAPSSRPKSAPYRSASSDSKVPRAKQVPADEETAGIWHALDEAVDFGDVPRVDIVSMSWSVEEDDSNSNSRDHFNHIQKMLQRKDRKAPLLFCSAPDIGHYNADKYYPFGCKSITDMFRIGASTVNGVAYPRVISYQVIMSYRSAMTSWGTMGPSLQ
ncbi:hypothetical protein BJY01DRAFT_224696 [Aspergillus pseudoustus]|uniref:Peptidase S8/S53 domain-containing protein n=1 Tax=Aspergillus pseudoustus TaxID=1810923 RepID=A0ABR4J205_9EURO